MNKFISALISALLLLYLFACGGEKEPEVTTLLPVSTVGIPEEVITDTVDTGTFTVNIYKSYAEIVAYTGENETEVVIPESIFGIPVKIIGEYAFYDNETIEKVTLPSSLIEINRFAFEECKALTEVVANEGLEVIDQAAFRNSALERINVPSTVVTIGKHCFYRTAITEIVIPDGVSSIPSFAFYGCDKLVSVTFGKRVSVIDEKAFHNCSALVLTEIPDTVTKLGDYSFMNCSSIAEIFIPKATFLGENTFYGCRSLVIHTPKGARCITNAETYGYEYVICESPELMGQK